MPRPPVDSKSRMTSVLAFGLRMSWAPRKSVPTSEVLYSPRPWRLFTPSYGEWKGAWAWKMMFAWPAARKREGSEWGKRVSGDSSEGGRVLGGTPGLPGRAVARLFCWARARFVRAGSMSARERIRGFQEQVG